VFDQLAKAVAEAVTLACDWDIPATPMGEVFDKGKSNVQITLDGKVEDLLKAKDAAACGTVEGWHYNDENAPTKVVACPATCTRIQTAAEAKVDLLFGCETKVVPVM
jgi:hypothetical protein